MAANAPPTPTPIQRMAREAAERSRREQGLPLRLTDPALIVRVAKIVRARDSAASASTLARTA